MASTTRRVRKNARPTARIIPLNAESRVVRWAKVTAVQKRIASGHYDRPEVREKLIDEVLRELRRS
jgi:antitoxin (DNA-binding transcriptional repressor) of toxin-antitoxin stability system